MKRLNDYTKGGFDLSIYEWVDFSFVVFLMDQIKKTKLNWEPLKWVNGLRVIQILNFM